MRGAGGGTGEGTGEGTGVGTNVGIALTIPLPRLEGVCIRLQDLQRHLETEYVQMMIDDPHTRPVNNRTEEQVAAQWISSFTNHSKDDSAKSYPPRGPRPQ